MLSSPIIQKQPAKEIEQLLTRKSEIIKKTEMFFISLEDIYKLRENIATKVQSTEEEIANKYLYLGPQGALAWKNVDIKYELGNQSLMLLKDHFDKIDSIIRDEIQAGYDIVSLGCGTCMDDKTILTEIEKITNLRSVETFNVIVLDFSLDLLYEGAQFLYNFISGHPISKYIDKVIGINADIDKFAIQGLDIITNPNLVRKNQKALFHLLGLTLANNNEEKMLMNISNVMQDGDYLLLGLDFSLDDDISLKNSINSYKKKVYLEDIDRFLCSPFFFASKMQPCCNDVQGMEIITAFGDKDTLKYPINIIHKTLENNLGNTSAVNNAVNLVRYHKIITKNAVSIPLRKCDFSNKYSHSDFKKFLFDIKKREISFEIMCEIDSFGISEAGKRKHEARLHLVLLKKVPLNKLPSQNHPKIEKLKAIIFKHLSDIDSPIAANPADKEKAERIIKKLKKGQIPTEYLTEKLMKNDELIILLNFIKKFGKK